MSAANGTIAANGGSATKGGSAARKYDALVLGSGIGGMESALKLGDMGYKVLVVEKEPSVGGKMILLSKVFPTLDCASCISTPKMGATIHHPNIDVLTYSEVEGIRSDGNGGYHATIRQKPKYVDEATCTGCRQCETACNVAVPDEFNADMVSRRAAYIAFPQAVPKKAVIDRVGVSPCTFDCPAGIKAHGYVARVRSGEYDQAFDLVLETTPLVGSLGRACYAPCEGGCTRGELEGTLPIRRLKRFIADRRYEHVRTGEATPLERPEQNGHKVAVVGSGPAGLTAAWQLARQGYGVKIFEAAPQPGGMLRLALPDYRLPKDVVDDDVRNVTDLGVEIETGKRVDDVAALRDKGFDAVLVATGTHKSLPLGVPGEDLDGVLDALTFLADVNLRRPVDLTGRRVLVVGGGDVAVDTARTALRLGACEVRIVYRRSRDELPAQRGELDCAEAEGVIFDYLTLPVHLFGGEDGTLTEVECVRTELGEPDGSGRRRPVKVPGSEFRLPVDAAICATGMAPDTAGFGLQTNDNGTLVADAGSLQTALPYVFAAGDVVDGPTTMTAAIGQGRRAAFMIDRFLQGETLDPSLFDEALPVTDKTEVLARQDVYDRREPFESPAVIGTAPTDFSEIEGPMSEEEALLGASRCLDCGVCSECRACIDVCPADCIDFSMREEEIEVDVDAVVLATGFKLFPADAKPEYGYGKFKNVITGMQMDRLLAPTRPFNSVVRPGDGKVPDRIGFIMCTGSRDAQVGNPLCSRICCMYSVKHNQLIMGALPLADVTVHYMDVRAVGKGYDEFYKQAVDMGSMFIKGRVAKITEKDNGDLIVRYEDIEGDGGIVEAEYDMVVLAVGVQPNTEVAGLFEDGALGLDDYFYVGEVDEDLDPGRTNLPGVFVAGSASGVKDIPDSILHAGAAVAQAAAHIEKAKVAVDAVVPDAAKVEVAS